MSQTERPTEPPPTETPEPKREQTLPPCIAFLLHLARLFIRYGHHLDTVLPERTSHPRFPSLAVGFGTHDIRRILAHVERGILRALMLQKFLLARAAQDRDIEIKKPPERASQAEIDALAMKLPPARKPSTGSKRRPAVNPNEPVNFHMPTAKELEAQVRSRPVGQTIAEICMDLGIFPGACDAVTWDEILRAMTQFGANLAEYFRVRQERKDAFLKERARRPETRTFEWDVRQLEAIRALLGCSVGAFPDSASGAV